MHNKIKIGQIVFVKGIGKCNGTQYNNAIGKVIGKDDFFLDYEIQFENGSIDWIDKEYIKKKEK